MPEAARSKWPDDKPATVEHYQEWLRSAHGVEIERAGSYYELVSSHVKEKFEASDFWTGMQQLLAELDERYFLRTDYRLLHDRGVPKLFVKDFDAFLVKTFRRNILENDLWPNPPEGGWVLDPDWLSSANDIVRTLFVVKYLDGVADLAEGLKNYAAGQGIELELSLQARIEGYYAAHLHGQFEFEIPRRDWDTERRKFTIELQITTQLQELIRRLTHKFYEERRIRVSGPPRIWQWDYESDEFVSNYLGHILHYVEGMIMDVRKKQREERRS